MRWLCAVLVVFAQGALVQSSYAQSAQYCQDRIGYLSTCRTITATDQCSQQLMRTCCGCQAFWDFSFPFCSFQPNLVPLPPTPTPIVPTPTPLPTATATPVPSTPQPPLLPDAGLSPVVSRKGIECRVQVLDAQSYCLSPDIKLLVDGSKSKLASKGKLSYTWELSCSQGAETYAPQICTKNCGGFFIGLKPSQAVLAINEPQLGRELRCDVALTVKGKKEAKGKLSARCGTSVLINNCQLGCTSRDLHEYLMQLEKFALDQRKNLEALSKLMKKAGVSGKAVKETATGAKKLFDASKAAVSAIPVLMKTCQNQAACAGFDHSSFINEYKRNAELYTSAFNTGLQNVKKAKNGKGQLNAANKLVKQGKKLAANAEKVLVLLPQVQSACVGADL
jgi:hypothetical protein